VKIDDGLKLTTYTSERARVGDAFLADALIDLYARHEFQTSVLLRGTEGFGVKHRLQTQRLLSLSEDLPIVTVAVDTRPRIEAALPELTSFTGDGLVTLERARLFTGTSGAPDPAGALALPEQLNDETKLTIWCGRQQRAAGRPAFVTVVDLLRGHGVAGATVLLGVDGTAHGIRRRAAFFGRNADVPLMIVAVGSGAAISAALPEIATALRQPLLTLERVRVCKRDGRTLAPPHVLPPADPAGLGIWQKLMVYSGEQSRHDGRTLHVELVRRLRAAGLSGATALRGIWGYHGDHRPHGDKLLALRRHVPVVTVVIDTPQRIQRAFAVIDEVTGESSLVTSERVPAFSARHDGSAIGGLDLAVLDD
jgi:PII-like signaling protein